MTKPQIKELLNYKLLIKILKKYPKSSSTPTGIRGVRDYQMGYSVNVITVPEPYIRVGWISQGYKSCGTYREVSDSVKQQLIDELAFNGFELEVTNELSAIVIGFNLNQPLAI